MTTLNREMSSAQMVDNELRGVYGSADLNQANHNLLAINAMCYATTTKCLLSFNSIQVDESVGSGS